MKKSLIILAIAALGSMPLQAKQPGSSSPPDLSAIVSEMQLDQARSERLEQLVQQQHQSMQGLRGKKRILRSEFREMRAQHREELLGVLSHEQLYQFEKLMHEQRHKRRKDPQYAE